MYLKTARQQKCNQPATSMRKYSQRAKPQASMTTEYQERYCYPHCHKAAISTSKCKDPYHPLKPSSADVTTFRSYYVGHKWTKNPTKATSVLQNCHRRCSSTQQNPVSFEKNQMASKVEGLTSLYQRDFQAWKVNKRQPYRLTGNLRVNQGLIVPEGASKEDCSQKGSVQVAANSQAAPQVQEQQPIESITSYRSDYVSHPVQPRKRRKNPVNQANKGVSFEPKVCLNPKVTWDINQELFDEASEFFQRFKTWSLETKFHGQVNTKESSPPVDPNRFLSTTHADYMAQKCQRTKPVPPSTQTSEKSNSGFPAMTTMKEECKAWDTPRCSPTVQKEELDRPKKTTFSRCTPKPAENCNTTPKPSSAPPKLNETAACNASCNATEKPQTPAEEGIFSGFECISTKTEASGRFWTSSFEKGVALPDAGIESMLVTRCGTATRERR